MALRHGALAVSLCAMLLSQGCGNHAVMTAPSGVAPALHTASNSNRTAPRYVNRMVVKFRSGTSESQIRSFQQRFALSSVKQISSLGVGIMEVKGKDATSALSAIQGQSVVEYAEPDFIFSLPKSQPSKAVARRRVKALASAPTFNPFSATALSEEWGMKAIGAQRVWSMNTGASNVVVAVLDTGVDMRHPDLAPNLVGGISVLPGAVSPDDDHGHGTHVAGVIAGMGEVAGVAPRCKIMPVKVLNREGKGDTGDIVEGLIWAVNNGATVINMSLGGTGGSRALMDAVNYALRKNVVLVAAMGNEGINSQEYPAGYPGVIAVGATDEAAELASFSNTGSWISVSAPGCGIYSTLPTHPFYLQETQFKSNHYDRMDGTSMASPFVAGVAALVKSQYPTMPVSAVKARIERSAKDLGTPGFDEQFGHGQVDAYRAVMGN